jgi:YD repeat-containing protein
VKTDPVTNYWGWTMGLSYLANGSLYQSTDARGVVVTFDYDGLGRNTTITYTSDPAGTPTVSRFYDGYRSGTYNNIANSKGSAWRLGLRERRVRGIIIDGYDVMGRPTLQEQQFNTTGGWSAAYKVSRSYDQGGHVTSQTYPSGHTANYNYDQAGRLGDKVPGTQNVQEMAFRGSLGDGVMRTYSSALSYDEASRLSEEKYGTLTPLYHKQHFNVRGQLYDIRLSTVPSDPWNWNRGAIVNYYDQNCQWGHTRKERACSIARCCG